MAITVAELAERMAPPPNTDPLYTIIGAVRDDLTPAELYELAVDGPHPFVRADGQVVCPVPMKCKHLACPFEVLTACERIWKVRRMRVHLRELASQNRDPMPYMAKMRAAVAKWLGLGHREIAERLMADHAEELAERYPKGEVAEVWRRQ